jgi:TolB-like protein/tetratricopeptide (TPR) repeat protein
LSLFEELKRRKVVRVAVVYAATAFAIVQAADVMLPRLGVPDWTLTLIVVLVVLGFPAAVVLGWALELTPEGLRVTAATSAAGGEPPPSLLGKRTVFASALLVAVGIGLGAGWFLRPATESPGASPPAASMAPATGEIGVRAAFPADAGNAALTPISKSIAVLPFVNMSADADNEYFADGISEELLNVLVKVDDIGVASRTSSFAYKGRELGAAVIARELKVNHILEGSVRKSGNRVRITAQLIDAVEDRHLWSETYDRELDDIFAIQDEIANAIVAALRGTLGSGEVERAVTVRADTDNLDAYQLYLKARELFITRTQLDESVRLFEQVVALDPEFARGWEGLAAASAVIVGWVDHYSSIDTQALIARSERAAARALAIDPSLSMPWVARSMVASELNAGFTVRLELVDRAIAADPRNATAYLSRGLIWVALGFFDRSLDDLDQCLAIDPAYGNCLRWKATVLLVQADVDRALELYAQGMADGFNPNRANSFIEPLIRRGNRFAAVLLMRELDWPVEVQQAVVATLGDGASPPDVAALVRRHPQIPRAQFHWGLLLRDYALAAEQEVRLGISIEHWDPAYEGLRASPAFKRILERIGAPAYWREHGYPPQCRPVGDDDFECPI